MPTMTCERNLPLKVEEEKQGIVSILGSNTRGTKPPAAASIRRTLSADMSSTKWLAQNGFSKQPMMKRISSSAQLSFISASSSEEEEDEEFNAKKIDQSPTQVDVWSLIVSQKKTEDLPPPYVHPLVKKSSSSLCSKSLEICTESLGSETGSDKVTWCQPLETGFEANGSGMVEQLPQPLSQYSFSEKPPAVAKYNTSAAYNKKTQPKSFPPTIPLLAGSSEGPSLHMHSHRENGRLVLEAISVPSTKKLQAHRQDGCLRLTFIQPPTGQQHVQQPDQNGYEIEDNLEDVFDIYEQEEDDNDTHRDDDETTEETDEELNEILETVKEKAVPEKARGVINIHRSALMMKKIMVLENQNPKWSHKFNHAAAKLETKYENEKETTLPQSLPPRPRTRPIPNTPPPAAASFNAYEYFWRTKPATTGLKNSLVHCSALKNNNDDDNNNNNNKVTASNKPKSYDQQELLVLRNCRKARRSLLSWDAYCIATT